MNATSSNRNGLSCLATASTSSILDNVISSEKTECDQRNNSKHRVATQMPIEAPQWSVSFRLKSCALLSPTWLTWMVQISWTWRAQVCDLHPTLMSLIKRQAEATWKTRWTSPSSICVDLRARKYYNGIYDTDSVDHNFSYMPPDAAPKYRNEIILFDYSHTMLRFRHADTKRYDAVGWNRQLHPLHAFEGSMIIGLCYRKKMIQLYRPPIFLTERYFRDKTVLLRKNIFSCPH